MKIPKSPMPQKEKIMKKIKKTLENQGETELKLDLKKLATELSERREKAITEENITQLKAAALEIVDRFDINNNRTVFRTNDRDSGRDEYFFDSAENTHCFLEEGALDSDGKLLKPARLAINKIGHAMHDLNPEFEAFCKNRFWRNK